MSTTSHIKDILMDELESLVKGDSTIERAHAVAKLSAQAIYATRIELENKRMEIDIGNLFGQVRWENIDGQEVSIPRLEYKGIRNGK